MHIDIHKAKLCWSEFLRDRQLHLLILVFSLNNYHYKQTMFNKLNVSTLSNKKDRFRDLAKKTSRNPVYCINLAALTASVINDSEKHKISTHAIRNFSTLLSISRVYKILSFCVSLIRSIQGFQINTKVKTLTTAEKH